MANTSFGLGVGLRPTHYHDILEDPEPMVQWLEVISENFMNWQNHQKSKQRRNLLKFREKYPVVLHGVAASLGSKDGVPDFYLKQLKDLVDFIEPAWVSDHACFGQIGGIYSHDLLPMPYTKDAMQTMVSNIQKMQEALGRPIGIENISSYLEFADNEMQEWDFLSEVVQQSGCFLLLDINNVFVNANNHGIDAKEFLNNIPHDKVQQIHMAGHSQNDDLYIDTHAADIRKEVFELFYWYCQRYPVPNYMIERDDEIPKWKEHKKELKKLKDVYEEAINEKR